MGFLRVAGVGVDVGCVRMTERHLRSDPPTQEEVDAARGDVRVALDAAEEVVPLAGIGAVVGLAGSITTVTARALDLPRYDPERIHLARVPAADHLRACADLLAMTRDERSALPYMHPGRADVIDAGALIWSRILARVPVPEHVVSEADILDGIAWSLA